MPTTQDGLLAMVEFVADEVTVRDVFNDGTIFSTFATAAKAQTIFGVHEMRARGFRVPRFTLVRKSPCFDVKPEFRCCELHEETLAIDKGGFNRKIDYPEAGWA